MSREHQEPFSDTAVSQLNFSLSPRPGQEKALGTYFESLKEDTVFAVSHLGQTRVVKAALGYESAALFVLGEFSEGAVKPCSLAKVTYERAAS